MNTYDHARHAIWSTACTTANPAVHPTNNGDSSKWWILVAAIFGVFVSILDATVVNTALPNIQAAFRTDLHQTSYIATGYTLAQGVVIATSGYLANRFGIKRVYLTSLTLFTLGSTFPATAPAFTTQEGRSETCRKYCNNFRSREDN